MAKDQESRQKLRDRFNSFEVQPEPELREVVFARINRPRWGGIVLSMSLVLIGLVAGIYWFSNPTRNYVASIITTKTPKAPASKAAFQASQVKVISQAGPADLSEEDGPETSLRAIEKPVLAGLVEKSLKPTLVRVVRQDKVVQLGHRPAFSIEEKGSQAETDAPPTKDSFSSSEVTGSLDKSALSSKYQLLSPRFSKYQKQWQLPLIAAPASIKQIEPTPPKPTVHWSVGVAPTLTSQNITILEQVDTRIGIFSTQPALSTERWGLQASLQASIQLNRRIGVTGSLLYSLNPHWERYAKETNTVTVTYVDAARANQSAFEAYSNQRRYQAISARLEGTIGLGNSFTSFQHTLRGGVEWQPKLLHAPPAVFVVAGYSRRVPFSGRGTYVEPFLRYGLTHYTTSDQRLKIRPSQLGVQFRIDLTK